MGSKRSKQVALLTMHVNARQAARAMYAAYGRTYRKGTVFYRNRESDWFFPIAFYQCAADPQPKENQVKVLETVTAGAKAIGQAVGLIEDPHAAKQREEFRKLCEQIALKATVEQRQRETGAKLQAALEGRKAGLVEIDGRRIDFVVNQLEHEYSHISAELHRVQTAESQAIGLCPSATLQRERRDLQMRRTQICDAIKNCEQHIDEQIVALKLIADNIKALSVERSSDVSSDLANLARRQSDCEIILDELREEHVSLIQDLSQWEIEREELYSRMRSVQV